MKPNDWEKIRSFYHIATPIILKTQSNRWSIDPYAWDEIGVRLTPIEAWLWSDIRQAGAIFYPQFPVGRFFVDFANPVAKVVIECDGKDFHTDEEKDKKRDAELVQLGWSVYRINGKNCRTDFDVETKQKSTAHFFIESICKNHKVSGKWMP